MTSVYKTRQWAKDAVSRRLFWKKLTSGTGFPSGASQGREANSPSNTVILNGSRLNIFFKSAHIKVKHAEKRIMSQLFCIKKKKKKYQTHYRQLERRSQWSNENWLRVFLILYTKKEEEEKKERKEGCFSQTHYASRQLEHFLYPPVVFWEHAGRFHLLTHTVQREVCCIIRYVLGLTYVQANWECPLLLAEYCESNECIKQHCII